ncbi:MAG TPA: hypothetical protein DER40_00265 [Geobacter sp.]|nr:hypothetical protein [Geobacter sp.]HCE65988.1 hypothetical protein [Geobacter sp.]
MVIGKVGAGKGSSQRRNASVSRTLSAQVGIVIAGKAAGPLLAESKSACSGKCAVYVYNCIAVDICTVTIA